MSDEILERLPDGVVVVGADLRIAYLNAAAEGLSGWIRTEAIGRPYHEVLALRDAAGFPLHERGELVPRLRTVRTSPERELLLRRRDGEERWVAVRAAFDRDESREVRAVLVTIRDIGRRRRLDHARSDLIATVSHEIRSPLTSVKGFTSTLLRKWERFNDEQKRHMLTMINHDADRVTRLLTDLLDVSRLEAGRLELKRQEVDVSEIAAHVADRLGHSSDGRVIEVRFPESLPKITADPAKIEQVIVNLVENAIKYAEGPILVSGEATDDDVVVRVTDGGPGIDARHLPHIFTKFYRHGQGERGSGTGLGLYITKGIVEAHRGRIEVGRGDEGGTIFTIALPRGD